MTKPSSGICKEYWPDGHGRCTYCCGTKQDHKEAVTSATPPASPTSADIGFPASGSQSASPSHVARGEWPKEWLDALSQFARNGDEAHDPQDGTEILDALASVGALRPPSPPAVVGKPTSADLRTRLVASLHKHEIMDRMPIPKYVCEAAVDDALNTILAIWPTSEPPATVDDGVESIVAELERVQRYASEDLANYGRRSKTAFERAITKLRQRTGSGITREDVAKTLYECDAPIMIEGDIGPLYFEILQEGAPSVYAGYIRRAEKVLALISGKKG